jgi:hypothetical protein
MLWRKINDPKHWRNRAAAMRAVANRANDEQTIAIMNRLASDYDKLADRATQLRQAQTPITVPRNKPVSD